MIPQQNENKTTASHDLDVKKFGMSQESFSHLFNMLSQGTYERPIDAVMREYATNGWDAMIEAGTTETHQLQVTLPTSLEPTFRVRDYGTGLTEEQIDTIYIFLGESTKNGSNAYNGMLGIGSKAGFAYAPNWQVISYVNGVKNTYAMFTNDANEPNRAHLLTEETDEHNGIEIVIPVTRNDIRSFSTVAPRIYAYFNIVPTVFNAVEPIEKPKALFEGAGWRLTGSNVSYAVMGNVAYPIEAKQIITTPNDEEKEFGIVGSAMTQMLAENGLEIDFNIGDVEFAISREGLRYTNYTKRNLTKRIEGILDEVAAQVSKSFEDKENIWEAKKHFHTVFSEMGNLGTRLRRALEGKIMWNNIPISGDYFNYNSNKGVKIFHYTTSWRRNDKPSRNGETTMITARDNTPVIINDINKTVGSPGRITELYNKDKFAGCYVLTFESQQAKDTFFSELNFDTVPTRLLSSLDKPVANKVANAKHSGKCFTLNRSTSYGVNSESWENEPNFDFEDGEGVWLALHSFEAVNPNSRYSLSPSTLKSILSSLEKLGVTIPTIYGIKNTYLEKKTLGDGWTDFYTWAKAELESVMASQNVLQKVVDTEALNASYSDEFRWFLNRMEHKVVDTNSALLKYANAIKQMKLSDEEKQVVSTFTNIYQTMGQQLATDKAAPSYDIATLKSEVYTRYPLVSVVPSYNTGFREAIIQYVNAIDAQPVGI